MNRNAPCFCGLPQKMKHCTESCLANVKQIDIQLQKLLDEEGVILKTDAEIQKIADASKVAAEILDALCLYATEGVSLEELNTHAMKLHKEAGVIPAPLGYGEPPYPKAICTSVNDVICHGIPSPYKLVSGDILNIDVSVILDGYFGDCSKMVCIGNVSEEDIALCKTTYNALMLSISKVKPGVCLSEIGGTIQKLADSKGYSVVRDFVGHGIGLEFHEGPNVLHCANSLQLPLQVGMTFTIEPMLNAGQVEHYTAADKWCIKTIDGKKSAQYEHTLVVTSDGAKILTPWTVPEMLK